MFLQEDHSRHQHVVNCVFYWKTFSEFFHSQFIMWKNKFLVKSFTLTAFHALNYDLVHWLNKQCPVSWLKVACYFAIIALHVAYWMCRCMSIRSIASCSKPLDSMCDLTLGTNILWNCVHVLYCWCPESWRKLTDNRVTDKQTFTVLKFDWLLLYKKNL